MKHFLLTLALLTLTFSATLAQIPSEQFVLWKVWSADSAALKNQGYGDFTFSSRDTVILEGSDCDTVLFPLGDAKGIFTLWVIPDTANFPTAEGGHNHILGESDSLSLSYRPCLDSTKPAANPVSELQYLKFLDWEAEKAYYETISPPLSEYLQFYLEHTGAGDTSAVIIELLWQ